MSRYFTRPHLRKTKSYDDYYEDEPNAVTQITVYEPDENYIDSGLLDHCGDTLYRSTMEPIGFHLNSKEK